MDQRGITGFLQRMKARAERDVSAYLALLRFGLPLGGAIAGTLLAVQVANHDWTPVTDSMLLLGSGLGGITLGLAGSWLARRSAATLPQLRAGIRHDLVNSGLLQLVLEHDPYGRLPSLRPAVVGPVSKQQRLLDSGSMQERLGLLIRNYEKCCGEAGLRSSPDLNSSSCYSRTLLIGATGMFIAGLTLLATYPALRYTEFWVLASLGLLMIWLWCSFVGGVFRIRPLPAVLGPSALRMELAEILSPVDDAPNSPDPSSPS